MKIEVIDVLKVDASECSCSKWNSASYIMQ